MQSVVLNNQPVDDRLKPNHVCIEQQTSHVRHVVFEHFLSDSLQDIMEVHQVDFYMWIGALSPDDF